MPVPDHRLPFVVGLTGGIGSGKSLVAAGLVARGAGLVDTDRIAHALTAPGGEAIPAIRKAFGASVLTPDGALDRPAMRRIVFADPAERERLQDILHPLIRHAALAAAQALSGQVPYVVMDIPLLAETGRTRYPCQRVLVVDCPEAMQIERVMARNGFSRSEVEAILRQQASRTQRLALADDVVHNDGPLADLPPQLDQLHVLYGALSQEINPKH